MAQAVRSEAWQHTSWIVCTIMNVNRDVKKRPRPFMPDEFNPMATGAKKAGGDAIVITKENVGLLREAFGTSRLGRKKKQTGPIKAGPPDSEALTNG
jgi:hypothetical protein